ncbi:rubrerythrin [Labrenzia sp. EL_13]|nr:rubrerythrin [Labrenzia sp. EL_13]
MDVLHEGITLGIARHDKFISADIYSGDVSAALVTVISLAAANQESEQKSHAVKEAYKARAKRLAAGEKIKLASVPFWIDRETYQVLDEHRPTLERLIGLIRSGSSYLNTSRLLNNEGVSPPKGKMWRQSSIQSIMNNPALYGAARFGDAFHENIFEPMMTKTQWQLIQDQNKGRKKAPRSVSGDIPNLFPAMLRCGKCGGPMSIHATKREGRSYQYFRCFDSKALPKEGRCGNRSIKVEAFEQSLLDSLFIELNEDRDTTPVVDDRDRDMKRLTNDMEATEKKLDVAMDRALSAGSESLRDRYEKTAEDLDGQLKELNKQLAQLKLTKPSAQELDTDDIENIFKTLEDDRKNNRQVLQARLSRIIDHIDLTLGSYQDVIGDPEMSVKGFKGLAGVTLRDGSKFTVGL